MPKFRDYPDANTLTGQEYAILSQNTGVSNTVTTVKVNLDVMFMNRFRNLYGQMNVVLAGVTTRMDALQAKVDSIPIGSGSSNTTSYIPFDASYLEANIASLRQTQNSFSSAMAGYATNLSTLTQAQQNTANVLFDVVNTQNTISSGLSGMTIELTKVKSNMANLSSSYSDMSSSFTSMQANVASVYTVVTDLQSQYRTLSNTVLSSNTVALEANVAALRTDLGVTTNTVVSLSSNVALLSNTVLSINTTIGALSSNLVSVSNTVLSLNTAIGSIGDNVTSLTANVSALTANDVSIRASITSVQNNFTSLSNTVNVITGTTIPDLQANVTFLASQTANNVTIKNAAPKSVYRFSGSLSISGLLAVGKTTKTLTVTGVKPNDAVIVTPLAPLPTAFIMGEAFVSSNDTITVAIYVGALITLAATTVPLDVVVLR